MSRTTTVVDGVVSSALSAVPYQKSLTAIADSTATTVFAVSIPNAQVNTEIEIEVFSALGAGGAIGAGEANGHTKTAIAINRQAAGVVAVLSSVATPFEVVSAVTAGGATITTTVTVANLTGAAGAVNTFNIKVTIAAGSGSATNHTATMNATINNIGAGAVTMA